MQRSVPGTLLFGSCVLAMTALCSASRADDPTGLGLKLINDQRIWDGNGTFCAFTDLIRYKGRLYCAFREGATHVSEDGKLRILSSADGQAWTPAALIEAADG